MGSSDRVVRRRWSSDPRGGGIGDGSSVLPVIDTLRAEMADDRWLTEDVQSHLAEPLVRAATAIEVEVRASVAAGGVLLVEATVRTRDRRESRAIAYRWLAEVAEAQTVVQERHGRGRSTFLIATGQPDGPRFCAHGHVIELRLRRASR